MKLLLIFVLVFGAAAQQPTTPLSAAQKDAKRRLGLVATRAIGNFHSADSIEAALRERGQTLNPQLVALRLRIEAALDEAQEELDMGDARAVNETLDRAQGFLDRFVQRLGGS